MTAPFAGALCPALWDAAIDIAQRRLSHELALVSSVLAEPRRGIAAVRAVGLNSRHVAQDDLRVILFAAGVVVDDGRGDVLRLARRALISDGLWDANASSFERGRHWSDASLESFATEYPSAVEAKRHADALTAEVAKLDRADALYAQATATLTESYDALRINPVKRAKELVRFTRLSRVSVETLNEWRRRASA